MWEGHDISVASSEGILGFSRQSPASQGTGTKAEVCIVIAPFDKANSFQGCRHTFSEFRGQQPPLASLTGA